MDAKPSLLALTPVVRSKPVPMHPTTRSVYGQQILSQKLLSTHQEY